MYSLRYIQCNVSVLTPVCVCVCVCVCTGLVLFVWVVDRQCSPPTTTEIWVLFTAAVITLAVPAPEAAVAQALAALTAAVSVAELRGVALAALGLQRVHVLALLAAPLAQEPRVTAEDHISHGSPCHCALAGTTSTIAASLSLKFVVMSTWV